MGKMSDMAVTIEELRSAAASINAAADWLAQQFSSTAPEPPAEPQPEPKPALKLEDVRSVLAEKSRAGHTAEVRSLLLKYGAAKLSQIDPACYENAHVALDQKTYQKKYDDLTARYQTLKERIDELNEQIRQMQAQKADMEDFLRAFGTMPDTITEFSHDSFNGLVDFITVNAADDIQVTFRNGQTIKA